MAMRKICRCADGVNIHDAEEGDFCPIISPVFRDWTEGAAAASGNVLRFHISYIQAADSNLVSLDEVGVSMSKLGREGKSAEMQNVNSINTISNNIDTPHPIQSSHLVQQSRSLKR
jgi:hypothetical protein